MRQDVAHDRNIMAGAAREHEQVPHRVAEAQARRAEESHTERVGQSTGQQPCQAGDRDGAEEWPRPITTNQPIAM